jgi:4-aminobutyrate aminotransferase
VTELAERQLSEVETAHFNKPDGAQSALDQVPSFEGRTAPDLRTAIPGPKAREHVKFDHRFTSPSLPRAYPLVEDIDGNLFLDFTAGIAVSSTGYAHPRITAAIESQANDLIHFSASDFYLPLYAKLAAELDRISPMSVPTRAFIGNSGAEAVEAAIKLARFATGRQYLVGFLGGFHGRTYGAVTLTASKSKYHAGFGPMLPGVYHVPFGVQGLDELESRVFKRLVPANEVAAIIVEPIQGEGGYIVPEPDFFPRLRKICDDNGILLIADEVQSGAGRTGKMWAIQHWGAEPDILCVAKGIGSGMPVSAAVARADLMTWQAGHHGSTFGGNPVSCAAALATIELLEDGLIDNAAARGEQAMNGLRKLAAQHPGMIRDVRGMGLMIGVQFDSGDTAEAIQWAAFQRGLLVLEAGEDVVRMSPPLIVSAAEIDRAVVLFGEAMAAVATDPARALRDAHRWGADETDVDG